MPVPRPGPKCTVALDLHCARRDGHSPVAADRDARLHVRGEGESAHSGDHRRGSLPGVILIVRILSMARQGAKAGARR